MSSNRVQLLDEEGKFIVSKTTPPIGNENAMLVRPIVSGTTTLANGTETTVSSAAVQVAAANTSRRSLTLQNTGSSNVRVGAAGVTATTGLRLAAGASIVWTTPDVPGNALYAIREGTSDSVVLAQETT